MARLRTMTDGAREVGPFDVLVVGSGVAGLFAAVRLATAGHGSITVAVLTKGELPQSATRWAQGGVAVVLGREDSTDLHLSDTLTAGAGLCDADAVRVLVEEGPARVEDLIALGARFDRDRSGSLALAREGGHSRPRVVHAGGVATGAEVERALVDATAAVADAVLERWSALDLLLEGGRCRGVLALPPSGPPVRVLARHVVLATGGVGQLYAVTTNPPEATGDGIAMALRAGVPVADVEFVQFHPTALHHPAMPRPLLSEALRGHGALLRDGRGDRFVDELAPRDVVSRAMAQRMAEEQVDHLWLDATGLQRFAERFPTIAASLLPLGLDPAVDWLPIAPAAHHLSGGVVTDLWGATAVPGLWAVGEVACTGVHGANRLASNSLLEGMVFAARMADALGGGADGPTRTGVLGALLAADGAAARGAAARGAAAGDAARDDVAAHGIGIRRRAFAALHAAPAPPDQPSAPDVPKLRTVLQRAMTAGAGVVRSASSLGDARTTVAEVVAGTGGEARGGPAGELVNLTTVAAALLDAAELREESRGAHTRAEHGGPHERWRCRLVHVAPGGGR